MASRFARSIALAGTLAVAMAAPAAAQARDSLTQRFGTPRLMLTSAEAERLRALFVERTATADRSAPITDSAPQPDLPVVTAALTDGGNGADTAAAAPQQPPPDPVQLDALVYVGPDTWSFWLNGKHFTPRRSPDPFTVERVTGRAVTLRWEPGTGRTHVFTLKPRQTFDPASGRVTDGASLTADEGAEADG